MLCVSDAHTGFVTHILECIQDAHFDLDGLGGSDIYFFFYFFFSYGFVVSHGDDDSHTEATFFAFRFLEWEEPIQ